MNFPSKAHAVQTRAFSLVEVAVAIGIIAFALLSVAGLFPSGMKTLRSSMDSTTEGQIVQYMASSYAVSSFTNLQQVAPKFFDGGGRNLTNSADENIRYRVETRATAATLPDGSSFSTNDALCLQITVVRQPGPNGPGTETNVFAIQVANSGK